MKLTHNQIVERIQHLLPNAQFFFSGEDYSAIKWSDERPQPTLAEIEAVTDADLEAPKKEREAEDEARQIAIEEIIAERTQTALDNVKNEIAKGKITDARKAVRDEHKKLKLTK